MGAIRRIFIRVGAFIVDFEGRTLILSVLSLLANLFYATSFLFTAIISRSVFYCAHYRLYEARRLKDVRQKGKMGRLLP